MRESDQKVIAVNGTDLHERGRLVARSAGCHPCGLPEASAPRCQRNGFSVITSNHHELPEPREEALHTKWETASA